MGWCPHGAGENSNLHVLRSQPAVQAGEGRTESRHLPGDSETDSRERRSQERPSRTESQEAAGQVCRPKGPATSWLHRLQAGDMAPSIGKETAEDQGRANALGVHRK